MKRAVWIMILSVIGLFLTTGCSSIEDAIEDMTTRKITVSHVVYNGTPEQDAEIDAVMENSVVYSGETIASPIRNLEEFTSSFETYLSDLAPTLISLTGKISNSTEAGANVMIAIGPWGTIDDPSQWVDLGSMYIGAGESLVFEGNKGLTEPAEQVDANLYTFLSAHPEIAQDPGNNGAELFFTVSGNGDARVQVEFLRLTSTPVYKNVRPLSSSMIGGYSNRVKDISSVSLTGQVANNGITDMRFLLVISDYGESVNFETGLVADGFVSPGETANVSDLVVEGGLSRIKNAMYNLLDGDLLDGNIYLLSDATVNADVDDLEIESKITVGL
jgi:hypothetical protein